MRYKTLNHSNLEDFIRTNEDSYKLAQCTFLPSVELEQTDALITIMFEKYLEDEESRKNFIYDIENRTELVLSLFHIIRERVQTVEGMLLEIQDFEIAPFKKQKSQNYKAIDKKQKGMI